MILIVLIIGAAIGGLIGYKVAYWHLSKTTDALSMQSSLLHTYGNFWANEAVPQKYALLERVAQQQAANASHILREVLQLLMVIQQEQLQTMDKEQQQKIAQLIEQSRSITTSRTE